MTGQSSKIEAPFNFAPFAKALVKPEMEGFSIQMLLLTAIIYVVRVGRHVGSSELSADCSYNSRLRSLGNHGWLW